MGEFPEPMDEPHGVNLMDKPRLLGAIQPKEQPSGSATLRVNLMGEHSQRIKPQGSKPRRMDETSWQQPCLMGDNTSREQPDGVYSRAYWEQPRLLASFHGVWENLLGKPRLMD